jgi:hypothetical protein
VALQDVAVLTRDRDTSLQCRLDQYRNRVVAHRFDARRTLNTMSLDATRLRIFRSVTSRSRMTPFGAWILR